MENLVPIVFYGGLVFTLIGYVIAHRLGRIAKALERMAERQDKLSN